MKKIKLLILIIPILITSCSKDDIVNEPQLPVESQLPNLENFYYSFMISHLSVFPSNSNNLVLLEYDSINRLTIRKGGYSILDRSTGFNYFFDERVTFSLTYLDQEIIIERDPAYGPLNNKTTYLLENNKIVQKIALNQTPVMTFYEYNNNKISKSIEGDYSKRRESFFYYNTNKNIDSIISFKYLNDMLNYKTVEIFSNFDNTQNPLKNLMIFEDTFYRSLSENNYSKYELFIYGPSNMLIDQRETNWDIPYDDFGNIQFGV